MFRPITLGSKNKIISITATAITPKGMVVAENSIRAPCNPGMDGKTSKLSLSHLQTFAWCRKRRFENETTA